MKLVGLNWSQETRNFEETPIDIVDNMYLEGDVDNGVAITYPDGSCDFVGKILVKLEVNLEKEIDKEIDKEIETRWRGEYLFTSKFRESARHFFELGRAVSKKEKKETWKPNMAQINALTSAIKQIDKGNADVLKGLKEKLMGL